MDKGLRNTLIVSGVLGGITVGGYFLYRSILKAIEFDVEPKFVKVISRDAKNIKLGITMSVKNPSNLKLALSNQEYDVYLNDIQIARLTNNIKQIVYASSVSQLYLELNINYKNTWNKINAATGQGLEEKLRFFGNLKSQKMKLITKLDIQYGILPPIPIDIDSGNMTLKQWGFVD